MKTRLLILTVFFALFAVYGIDSAYALEFKPLVMKNTDNIYVSTGIVGEPIVFEYSISNDESDFVNFEIFFTTSTVRGKHLDQQILPVNLKSGETKTMTYQFIPIREDNYITRVSSNDPFIQDIIAFSALKDGTNYPKNTVKIYSDSSDEDCLIACTEPSEMTIGVGTVVEWNNTTPDSRHFSTGSYKTHENGASWSADKRFQSTIGPDKKSTFLFYQPGEYQFFLAEHGSSGQVIGTIHVLSDTFTESDRTLDILQSIMEDNDSEIPITLLYVDPKNSIITVGIDDRKNPLFTLEVYKTMLYKQVGNVFLNIVADHTPKVNPCDINDKVKVRNILGDDSVVQAFLERHPSAEFVHNPTYDEPGNPWITSQFLHDGISLGMIISTYKENGDCYWIRNYSISYDTSFTGMNVGLTSSQTFDSDQKDNAIRAVKDMTNPLKQIKNGIALFDVVCPENKITAYKNDNMNVACVTEETYSELIDRGWALLRFTMPDENPSNVLCNRYDGKWHPEYDGCRGNISDLQCSLMGGKFVDDLKICYNEICPVDNAYTLCVTNPDLISEEKVNGG